MGFSHTGWPTVTTCTSFSMTAKPQPSRHAKCSTVDLREGWRMLTYSGCLRSHCANDGDWDVDSGVLVQFHLPGWTTKPTILCQQILCAVLCQTNPLFILIVLRTCSEERNSRSLMWKCIGLFLLLIQMHFYDMLGWPSGFWSVLCSVSVGSDLSLVLSFQFRTQRVSLGPSWLCKPSHQ